MARTVGRDLLREKYQSAPFDRTTSAAGLDRVTQLRLVRQEHHAEVGVVAAIEASFSFADLRTFFMRTWRSELRTRRYFLTNPASSTYFVQNTNSSRSSAENR